MDTATTVLFNPIGLNLAEVTRMVEVARALRNHPGMRPVFLVHDKGFDHLVTQAGFTRLPGATPFTDEQARQVVAFDQGRTLRHPFTLERVRERVAVERAAIRDLGAAAVVHGTNPTTPISARAEGVPLFCPVPYAFSAAHLASGRGLPILPPHGPGRLLNKGLASLAARLVGGAPLLPASFQRVGRENDVRMRSLGDLLGADHVLLTAMPDEVGSSPLPAGHHRVGPVFARLDAPMPGIVDELAAGDRRVVYCAFGSSGSPELARHALRALAEAPVEVIAPLRQYLTPEEESRLPGNIHVTDLVPAHRLEGLVDAAVLHGGQGTVQTACATGIPFIGMGLSAEQRWNVDVWARRGNAIALSPRALRGDARRFRDALCRLLGDPGILQAARQVAREHEGVDGAAECARIIADEVGRSRVPTRGRPSTPTA